MLCPSVWEFKPKKSLFHDEKGEIIRFLNNPDNIINKHYFIHLVSVVLPDTPNIPECMTNIVTDDCDYYKVKDFSLHDLINSDFIHSFIENGQLTALSIDTHLETDDCAAITSNGKLVLSLNKESFQALGLEGKPYSRHKHRFCVQMDLRTEQISLEKKNLHRIQWCLKNNIKKFTMLFTWKPPEAKICPSSIAQYLSSLGYEVLLCKPKHTSRRDYNVTVPLFNSFDKDIDTSYELAEMTEWLGMYSLNADLGIGAPNHYLSTYECPVPHRVFGQVSFLKWTGFFSYHVVANLCNELRKYVTARKGLPWVSLYVQCCADAPLSNGERNHTTESTSYTIMILPSGYYHMVTQASSYINNSHNSL